MTISGWILYAFICSVAALIVIIIALEALEAKPIIISIAVTVIVLIFIWFGMHFYFTNTEAGKRSMRSQQSNLDGGINRTVSVYSYDGKLLREYSGKFDVTEDDHETYFDLDGKRIIIQGGIVINEEVNSNNGK